MAPRDPAIRGGRLAGACASAPLPRGGAVPAVPIDDPAERERLARRLGELLGEDWRARWGP